MYQIKCNDDFLYDPRIKELVILNPKCKVGANTVGEASFTIFANHPYYHKLKMLKSIVEILQNEEVIFRGRMTNNSQDFYNSLDVDLEGVLGFANDTVIAPFTFPDDFPDATASTNIIEYFLRWILDQHNAQAEDWQQLKLGKVTVADPNNYITRSSENYMTTWEVLKTKLFDSGLGGYLVARYEDDGNYVDFLSAFEYTNTQQITFGKNLLDIVNATSANETYSAILPLGAEVSQQAGEDYEGEYVTINNTSKRPLTLESLPDGDLTDDLVKVGKFIYSKSARAEYGWICVPPESATWKDVKDVENLKRKAIEYLSGTAMFLSGTITAKAMDLSFTDEQIQSFRVCRNVLINSPVHNIASVSYPLTTMEIDIMNPQNTLITIGDDVHTLVGISDKQKHNSQEQIGETKYEVQETKSDVAELKNQVFTQNTQVINECTKIILAALESYVETSNFETYKETVSTQLQILASEIEMTFNHTTENINNVAGDLQAEITERKKHITFSENGITIGAGENAMTLELDNDIVKFKKNGVQFGWWDGIDFHTGNIVVDVNERAQFGNFAFVPRSDGSLMFLKVGG
jgi:hypothetical protein